MYENQTEFEKELIYFGNRVNVIVGFEMSGKLNADDAYKQIKDLYKELKKLRKQEKKQDHPLDYDEIPERY
jgi:hypothetical protein